MLPGPVSNATTSFAAACGDSGEVGDAADVLRDSAQPGIAEQHVVEERNQRRAFAANRHIRRTKIRNHRNADSRGDNRCLTRLPRGGELVPKKTLGFALMIERLSMAADQIRFHAELLLGGKNCIGIKFAQNRIQAGQIGHAGSRSVHRGQYGRANLLGIRVFGVPEQCEGCSSDACCPCAPAQRLCYRRMCRSSLRPRSCLSSSRSRRTLLASFSARFRTSSRTSSPNSQSLRESFSTAAGEGDFVRRRILRGLFLEC